MAFCFISCGKTDDTEIADTRIKVMLSYGEGVTVTGENPVLVEPGTPVTFSVTLDDGYVFTNLSRGIYDNGTVTVEGLYENTTVKLFAEKLDYSTYDEYRYYFNGEDADTTSVPSSTKVHGGDLVTVRANENYRIFLGWSFDGHTVDKSKMISTEREYTFRISPDVANSNNIVRIYANYVDSGVYYYHLNGGTYNTSTPNTEKNSYYSLSKVQNTVKVTMSGDYLEVFAAVPLFWDDNTFTCEGYVLKEYNTEPDGSGVGYSFGSRYLIETNDGATNVLYCIWEKADPTLFEYQSFSYPCPTTAARAPHWHEEGIKITAYLGNAQTVAIPEMIDGKYVTGIANGAFVGKGFRTLLLPKTIQSIDNGAFVGCSDMETLYFPDSIYSISNFAFDEDSMESFRNLYVNATMAPRHVSPYAVKLSRLFETRESNRIIVIAGSSVYQGLSSEYLGALLDKDYEVVNFGTTRTTHGLIYLEAMSAYAHEGDIVLYAPENSSYMFGETTLYWKTLRDMESFYNLYRHIDISNYTNVFAAFAEFNQQYRYKQNPSRYEKSYDMIIKDGRSVNEYGEYQKSDRTGLASKYIDSYHITLNNRVKSRFEAAWDDEAVQEATKDYNDPSNPTWASIDDTKFSKQVNYAILAAKQSGAAVYFSFCPVDADKVVPDARDAEWLKDYDALISSIYLFDGVLGESRDYVYAHEYFYDNAFHLNDIGRAYRTYRVYLDLAELLGISPVGFLSSGTDFEGCIFEGDDGIPEIEVPYL